MWFSFLSLNFLMYIGILESGAELADNPFLSKILFTDAGISYELLQSSLRSPDFYWVLLWSHLALPSRPKAISILINKSDDYFFRF